MLAIGDYIVLPATHTRTIPAVTLQLQSITALCLVLIAPTHGGMARCGVTYLPSIVLTPKSELYEDK